MKLNTVEVSEDEIVLESDGRFVYALKREEGKWVARTFDDKGSAIGVPELHRNDLIEWLGTQQLPSYFILASWQTSLIVKIDNGNKFAMIPALYGDTHVQHAIVDESFVPLDVTAYGIRYKRVQENAGTLAVDFLIFHQIPAMPDSVAQEKLETVKQQHTQKFYDAVKVEGDNRGIMLTVNGTVINEQGDYRGEKPKAVILRVSDITNAPCENKPELLINKPIGMHHCYICGEMVMAGMPHPAPEVGWHNL